jgi:hypothetical protein
VPASLADPTARPATAATATARPWLLVAALVAVVALVCRLVPMLRGAGLFGLGNYDDAVYYAAATALAHGELPYRDFLLLHPPGIVLALTPFALLARLTSDHTGFALARLAWVLLGCLNAVLVARILRPLGLVGALLGGLAYAVMYPAVYVEWTTQLQGLGNTCLLLALALILGRGSARLAGQRALLVAGALLGVSASVKIWGAATAVLVLGWLLVVLGRRALALLVGIVAGATVVCLPFFVMAPGAMWRDVVTAQLGRQGTGVPASVRLGDIAGLHLYEPEKLSTPVLVLALVLLAGVLVLACAQPSMGLVAVLFVGLSAVLLASPSWFSHYAALVAPPLAVAFGAAAQTAWAWLAARGRFGSVAGALVLLVQVAVLGAWALPLAGDSFGRAFAGDRLARGVRDLPGCVVADNPAALIAMDVLGRNLRRGCQPMADLGGYSYVLARAAGDPFPRAADPAWQGFALSYFRSSSAVILTNYRAGSGLSKATAAEVSSWPVLSRAGSFTVRQPPPS